MSYISVVNTFVSGTPVNANPVNTNFNNITDGLKQAKKDLNVNLVTTNSYNVTVSTFSTVSATTFNMYNAAQVREEFGNSYNMAYHSPVMYRNNDVTSFSTYQHHGSCHDGKYGYMLSYVPSSDLTIKRFYLNTMSFVSKCTLTTSSFGYDDMVCDGLYVYILPAYNSSGDVPAGRILLSNFANSGISLVSMPTTNKTYMGHAIDSNYVYYVPYSTGGMMTRISKNTFAVSGTSYFNLTSYLAGVDGFTDGVTDGKYVYMCSYNNPYLFRVSVDDFSASGTTHINLSSAHSSLATFYSICFDGKYVYCLPFGHSHVARVDINNFSLSYISYLDISRSHIRGSCFDRRYIYMSSQDSTGDNLIMDTLNFTSSGITIVSYVTGNNTTGRIFTNMNKVYMIPYSSLNHYIKTFDCINGL